MSAPLIVTRDETLLDELLRLAAAAGVTPDVAPDPATALRGWAAAPVVLLGEDLAGQVADLGPPRRSRVHVLAHGPVAHEMFRHAMLVGAEGLVELPRSEGWVIELLADVEESAAGRVLGVVAGSGGAGATTFACALGQVAARNGLAVVVDADPLGPGVDRILGFDRLPGVRWDALEQTTGRLSGRAFRDALPRRDGLGVLTWTASRAGTLQAFAARDALAAARRGHDLVVVDLPRRLDPVVEEVASRCDHLFVVVAPTLAGVASAARVCARLGPDRQASLVVRRPGIEPGEIANLIGLPLAVELGEQRGLDEAVDLGLGPVRTRRGALARAARQALAHAADPLLGRLPA